MSKFKRLFRGFVIVAVLCGMVIPTAKTVMADEDIATEEVNKAELLSTIKITAAEVSVDQNDTTFDLLSDVSAVDIEGKEYEVSILDDGGFDITTVGDYEVTYGVMDPTTKEEVTQIRTIHVVAVEASEEVAETKEVNEVTPIMPLASSTINNEADLQIALLAAEEGDVYTLSPSFVSGSITIVMPNVNVTIDGDGVLWNTGAINVSGSGSGSITFKNFTVDASTIASRAITVSNTTGQVIFDNLDIRGSSATAIYLQSGAAAKTTIINSVIAENVDASAIYLDSTANVDIKDTTIENNEGNIMGYESAALSSKNYIGQLNINNTVFRNNKNSATGTIYGGGGGAIEIHYFGGPGVINISESYFVGNETSGSDTAATNLCDGGAIYVFDGKNGAVFNIDKTTFDSNIAHDDGGAIMFQSTGNPGLTTSITNSTFYGNIAQGLDGSSSAGGAIQYFYNGTTNFTNTIDNVTFANNTAGATNSTVTQNGGAISFSGGGMGIFLAITATGATYTDNLFIGNRVYKSDGTVDVLNKQQDIGLTSPSTTSNNLYNVILTEPNTIEDVLGINYAGLTTNFSAITAGKEALIIPTVPIKPEGLAENTGAIQTGADERGYNRNNDIGAIEATWVKYDANGGTFELTPLTAYDGSVYYEPNTDNTFTTYYDMAHVGMVGSVKSGTALSISRPTYEFLGWSMDPAATTPDTTFTPGTILPNIQGNATLYAVWGLAVETFDVTYDGNGNTGGSAPVDSLNPYDDGSTVTILDNGTLAKEGYRFVGWNTAADGSGTPYDAADTFTITADTTLYAQWVETFDVTYNGNGNTGGSAPVDNLNPYDDGEAVIILDNGTLVRDGYRFVGWNSAVDGSGTSYKAGDEFPIGADTTLYAQWVATFDVVYNGNGNTGGSAPVDSLNPYDDGNTVTILDDGTLVRDGYEFIGWNTAADGSGTSYKAGDEFPIGADTTLYAQWEMISKPSTPPTDPMDPVKPMPSKPISKPSIAPNVETGDTTNQGLLAMLLVVSGFAIAMSLRKKAGSK